MDYTDAVEAAYRNGYQAGLEAAKQTAEALKQALKDLQAVDDCRSCLHYKKTPCECEEADYSCLDCQRECVCKDCNHNENWTWRGIQREGVNHEKV